MKIEKLIIIGAGPAGLTAAIYTARANIAPLVFTGPEPGGQLSETTLIENFPGFPEGILGPELMDRFKIQGEKYGAVMINKSVNKVDLRQKPILIQAGNENFYCRSLIIATGATAKWLGLESETRLKGKGISACATCDGPMFKNKDIIVVGGGDAAMEEALYLTKFAQSIKIIHRRSEFRASKIMLDRAKKHSKIDFILNKEIVEFQGEKRLESVILKDTQTKEKSIIKIDGVFLAIGHIPNTLIFKEFLTTNDKNYLEVKNPPLTDIEGVFVAGDVYDWRYRQAITAAGSGCQAAIEAEKYLGTMIIEEE